VFIVNVTVLFPAVAAGLKAAVTPLGIPVADRLTIPVKPFFGVTVRVALPVLAWLIDSVEAELESVNEAAFDVPVRS
jgi:hypothetical protein